MVPITLGLGLINFNAFVDTIFAARLLDKYQAPSSINAAFRLYIFPQGMFSVAVATVLFPSLARLATRGDIDGFRSMVDERPAPDRVPADPGERRLRRARRADRPARLPARRLHVLPDDRRRRRLAAFALGLDFNGAMLMLNRAFFSLQAAWMPTGVALGNLGLNAALDAAFYRFGIWGIPLSTSIVNIAGTVALLVLLRRQPRPAGRQPDDRARPAHRARVARARRRRLRRLVAARPRARPPLRRPGRLARPRARRRRGRLPPRVPPAAASTSCARCALASPAPRALR